ncbi:MAG TPA: HAMP domain-containing sensor histidine kinase [Thermoanaerobaculia bacterium]|nr:HAMP domain-containing sensor histidine kinase [Thermoanaerobaculia bacterium]
MVQFNRSNAGTLILLSLLIAAMLLTAALTFEAVTAERAHQAAVRRAIRDDASVVADDLLHRTVFEFEMFASRPLRMVIANHLYDQNTLPVPAELAVDNRITDARFVIDRLFLIDTKQRYVSPPLPEPLQTWALTKFPAIVRDRDAKGQQMTYRFRLNGQERLVVYGVAQLDQGRIFAFTIPEKAIGILAARAFSRRSAFPGVLGGGKLTNADVFIRMSRGGTEVFRTPGAFDDALGLTMQAPRAIYGDAVGGLTVQCSIAPRAIPALIPGGLPRSRLPLLVLMLATSSMVLIAAFMVLRRERQLADLRSDFVSGVSHELRTPLTQIRMFSETLLLDRVRSPAERQRSLRIINEEAQRLTNLVDNVLFLSRGSRARVTPSVGDCDMEALVADTVEAFAPLAMRRDVVITADTPPRLHARVDAEGWKQVLTNMLDNAVKYGPPGQTVHVRLLASGGLMRLEVEDEGPGVPVDEREFVWRRFHRLDRDRGTARSGSGLGLAIVREIILGQGGRCWVEKAPGGGARFVVEAPLNAPAETPARTEGRA